MMARLCSVVAACLLMAVLAATVTEAKLCYSECNNDNVIEVSRGLIVRVHQTAQLAVSGSNPAYLIVKVLR